MMQILYSYQIVTHMYLHSYKINILIDNSKYTEYQ